MKLVMKTGVPKLIRGVHTIKNAYQHCVAPVNLICKFAILFDAETPYDTTL